MASGVSEINQLLQAFARSLQFRDFLQYLSPLDKLGEKEVATYKEKQHMYTEPCPAFWTFEGKFLLLESTANYLKLNCKPVDSTLFKKP